MSRKTLQISFDTDDILDKTLWDHLKNLPSEQRREFVLQSLLLNMHLPPIYQVCFLQNLLVRNNSFPTGSSFSMEQEVSTSVPAEPREISDLVLDRSSFAI